MYKEKLDLKNARNESNCLSNNFDEPFSLINDLTSCNNADEFCILANNYHRYGKKWKIFADSDIKTTLIFTDVLGNKRYLIAYKEPNITKRSGIHMKESVIDAICNGADRARQRIEIGQMENDMILACQALTEAKVSDKEILRLIGKYWDLKPSDAEYILGLSREEN